VRAAFFDLDDTAAAELAAGSYAYGDHISDLPLLSLVGHPVVVGAEGALGGYARRHGWDRLPAAA
jgi:phosphoserine phosphatase